MRIDHIAIWTNQLERLKDFYETYFQAKAGDKYRNPKTRFESYFLSFPSGARLELMYKWGTAEKPGRSSSVHKGYAHISYTTGSEAEVDELSTRLVLDSFLLLEEPRHTGDGYYECVLLDPDGNPIEITVRSGI